MADDKKNPLGPTGETVRANLERLRKLRHLSYKELSDLLAAGGRKIPTLGLSRIEKGERRVDADDLVALAVALDVNPSALLLPHDAAEDVEITGRGTVSGEDAWAWADGLQPLDLPDDPDKRAQYAVAFDLAARPRGTDRLRWERHERLVNMLRPGPLNAEQEARLFAGRDRDDEGAD